MTAASALDLALVRLLFLTGAYEGRLRELNVSLEDRSELRDRAMRRAYAQTDADIKSLVELVAAEPRNMAEALRRLPQEAAP